MIEFLLMASISCHDGWQIIQRVRENNYLSEQDKKEIIREIKKTMKCYNEKSNKTRTG